MQPVFLNLQEVAELLRVDHKTVRAMIRRGELPAAKVGVQFRIPRSAIDALVKTGEASSAAASEPKPAA